MLQTRGEVIANGSTRGVVVGACDHEGLVKMVKVGEFWLSV
jgi:hypothetical protein